MRHGSSPNSAARPLKAITDDQNRRVDYSPDSHGMNWEVRFNQTFSQGGGLLSYTLAKYDTDRMVYQGQPGFSHGWLKNVENRHYSLDQQSQWQYTLLVKNEYTYSDAGNRLTRAISDGGGLIRTEQYAYDALSRLTGVDYGDGETQSYGFDYMGNRTGKTVNQTSEGYTYNAANMLLTRGNASYTNDSNGNTLTGGGRTNTWDSQNRLTQCVFNNVTSTFAYGPDGLRRQSATGGVTTDYLLDGQNCVRTTDSNSATVTYLNGPRGPEYERSGNNAPKWNLYDGLGSVVGTVDGSGTILSKRKYDVYGSVRGLIGQSGTKHKFVGGLGHPSEDETGLIYMRARWMDPVTGRFASEDPEQDGINWFLYCDNNPVNLIDADGHFPVIAGFIVFFILLLGWVARQVFTFLMRIKPSPSRRLPWRPRGRGGRGRRVEDGDQASLLVALLGDEDADWGSSDDSSDTEPSDDETIGMA